VLAQASSGYRPMLSLSPPVVKERSTADKYQLTNYCYNCSILGLKATFKWKTDAALRHPE
jgi:hypothetical protein